MERCWCAYTCCLITYNAVPANRELAYEFYVHRNYEQILTRKSIYCRLKEVESVSLKASVVTLQASGFLNIRFSKKSGLSRAGLTSSSICLQLNLLLPSFIPPPVFSAHPFRAVHVHGSLSWWEPEHSSRRQ